MNLAASPTGRPQLFAVMRDMAIERGDAEAERDAMRAAELWHRAPEEWELERAVRASREQRLRNFIEGGFDLAVTPIGRLAQVRELRQLGYITDGVARELLDLGAEANRVFQDAMLYGAGLLTVSPRNPSSQRRPQSRRQPRRAATRRRP